MFLSWPWRIAVIVVLGAIEVFEVMLWLKLRNKRVVTGVEGLVGAVGRALDDCRPEGQVRVKGAIWRARCEPGVGAGDDVVVTGVRGLELDVRPR
jgi:membrane-bound serine protease (ClpP class)